MNKNRKIKRGLTTSLAVGMSVMMGAVPVFAAGTSSDADAVYKEETVYVNADATGTIDEVTVSNWLKNSGSVSGSLTDASTLKDIKNVKGDETFKASGDTLTWNTDGEDIYYQGTTDQDLPVSVKFTYYLDGKEIKPADLKGKKVVAAYGTVTYVYLNNLLQANGLSLDDVEVINDIANGGTLVASGNADAVVSTGTGVWQMSHSGVGDILTTSQGDADLSSQFFAMGRTNYLKENKVAAEAIIQALQRAKEYITQNTKHWRHRITQKSCMKIYIPRNLALTIWILKLRRNRQNV